MGYSTFASLLCQCTTCMQEARCLHVQGCSHSVEGLTTSGIVLAWQVRTVSCSRVAAAPVGLLGEQKKIRSVRSVCSTPEWGSAVLSETHANLLPFHLTVHNQKQSMCS